MISPRHRFASGTALALATLAAPVAAVAQVQSAPITAPTREEIQRQQVERDLRADATALSVDGGVERAPCPLSDPQFGDIRFTLSQAQFDGLAGLDPSLLDAAWRDYAGQEIPVAAICDIRDRAATILRAQGYLAAVQVPEQTIDTQTVRFDVLLARISAVQVRGDAGRNAGLLRDYIARLEGQPYFNTGEAERYLLLARDIPGLDVRLTLQPLPPEMAGEPGDVVAVFDVASQPFYADANIQNYGSRQVGRFGGQLRVRVNGLTGLGDATTLSVYAAEDFDEQLVLQGNHEFRLGTEGLVLGGDLTWANTQPDVAGPDVFESETLVASAYARYPLIRSQSLNLWLSGGFDFIDQEVEFSGLPLSEDKLRVAFARLDYDHVDADSIVGRGGYTVLEPRYAAGLSLEARQGFDIFGASEGCGAGLVVCNAPGVIPPSRLDGDPTGLVLRGDGYVDYRPTPLFGLRARTRFQYSPDALLSYEQFSGGNYTIGRGYDPGAVIGDSGVGVQLEAFYGSLVPETPDGFAVQPFVFADYTGTWTRNIANSYTDLTSVGGGIRATIARQATLDLTGAVPLETPPFAISKGDARVLLSLTVQLWPWYK